MTQTLDTSQTMPTTQTMAQDIDYKNMDPKPILLFDWDGTIVDSNNYKFNIAWQLTFDGEPERQAKIADILKRPIGRQLFRYALIALVIFETDPEQKDLEGVGNDDEWIRNDDRITKYSNRFADLLKDNSKMPAFPGTKETLEYLKKTGYKMYVVSGAGKTDILAQAEMNDLKEYFIDFYANEASKPESFKIICEKEGISNPSSYLIIGDGPVDLRFSQATNVPLIGIIDNDWNDWRRGEVDFPLINSVNDLRDLL